MSDETVPQPSTWPVWATTSARCAAERKIVLIADNVTMLLEWAERDPRSFDKACKTVARCLREGHAMTPDLAAFAADVIEGKRKRPRQRGPHPEDFLDRDLAVLCMVARIMRTRGLPATRGRNQEGRESACDVIATEYRSHFKMGYAAVERVWNKNRNRTKRIRAG